MTLGAVLLLAWTVTHPATQAVDFGISTTTVTVPIAPSKRQDVNVPAPVREFVLTMKALASKKSAPYKERIVPENPKADLGKILTYVGPSGLEFVDFGGGGERDPQRMTIRTIARDRLASQIQMRKGQHLLWLMEVAFYFRWWTDKPTSVETPEPGVLLVTFANDYALTFREQATGLQLVRVKALRDAEGGV